MKTRTISIGGYKVDIKYHNPVFKEFEVEGKIGDKVEKRHITLCQTAIPGSALQMITSIGVAVMNPEDENGDLGKTIAEGRAIKTPIKEVSIASAKRLPKAIAEEQLVWAAKHVERNLNDYVNNIRETLK